MQMESAGPRMPTAVVIDDDADLRDLLKTLLTQSGYEVVLTATAYDGVEAVRNFEPELTLLDLSMPGMDGFGAARRIRELTNSLVVVVSGWDSELDIVQALAAGADSYITKPFRTRELRARLEALVRRLRAVREEAESKYDSVSTKSLDHESRDSEHGRDDRDMSITPPFGRLPEMSGPRPGDTVAPSSGSHLLFSARDRNTWRPVSSPISPAPAEAPVSSELDLAMYGSNQRVGLRDGSPVIGQTVRDFAPGYVLRHNGLVLDKNTLEVKVHGSPVTLSDEEFALLATLMEHGNQVRSTASLVLALRGESYVTTYHVSAADRRVVANRMKSLRRKLGDSEADPRWIETVQGVGYRMTSL